jgi:hypothetical protein
MEFASIEFSTSSRPDRLPLSAIGGRAFALAMPYDSAPISFSAAWALLLPMIQAVTTVSNCQHSPFRSIPLFAPFIALIAKWSFDFDFSAIEVRLDLAKFMCESHQSHGDRQISYSRKKVRDIEPSQFRRVKIRLEKSKLDNRT